MTITQERLDLFFDSEEEDWSVDDIDVIIYIAKRNNFNVLATLKAFSKSIRKQCDTLSSNEHDANNYFNDAQVFNIQSMVFTYCCKCIFNKIINLFKLGFSNTEITRILNSTSDEFTDMYLAKYTEVLDNLSPVIAENIFDRVIKSSALNVESQFRQELISEILKVLAELEPPEENLPNKTTQVVTPIFNVYGLSTVKTNIVHSANRSSICGLRKRCLLS